VGIDPGRTARRRVAVHRENGIEVSIDWTVPFVLAAILLGLRWWILPQRFGEWSGGTSWALAFLAALSFFFSVLAHEIVRAATGLLFGLRLDRVSLFPFGGHTQFRTRPRSPSLEMTIALLGPTVHLVLGACFFRSISDESFAELSPVSALFFWMGASNLLLALIQLLPAFPLDGGRALRAVIWSLRRDLGRATRWAAAVGQVIAWALMGFGVAIAFGFEAPVVGASRFHGLWILAGGWLLNHAAVISYAEDLIRDALSHVQVRELMHDEPATVSRAMSISSYFASAIILPEKHTTPVVDGDNLLGFVRLQDVVTIPQEEWSRTPIGQIMIPLAEVPMLGASDDADLALQILVRQPVEQLPVVEHGMVLGFVHRWDIVHWLMRHDVPA
jgi:Zn-dependent protease/predicted transcriptional regulator